MTKRFKITAALTAIALAMAIGATTYALLPMSPGAIQRSLNEAQMDAEALHGAISILAIDFCGGGRAGMIETGVTNGSEPIYALKMNYTPEEVNKFMEPSEQLMMEVNWSFRDHCLTSPVAYLREYPMDPFTDGSYGYWPGVEEGETQYVWNAYIITSAGPDRIHSVNQRELLITYCNLPERQTSIHIDAERESRLAPLPEEQLNMLYDPTNGIRSAGDLVWISEHAGELEFTNELGGNEYTWWN